MTGARRASCLVLALVSMLVSPVSGAGGQGRSPAARLERFIHMPPDAVETFLDTLRRHVGRDERRATCDMIAYPLPQPDGPLADAAACEKQYDTLFTMGVRKAIGRQQFADLFVNDDGIMIGAGEVWIAPKCAGQPCAQPVLRIVGVHAPEVASLVPPVGQVLLACRPGGRQFAEVIADGRGGARLQWWRTPAPDGLPSLRLARAPDRGIGAAPSPCGARTWEFEDSGTTYSVSDLGCDAALAPPPMGAVGKVTLRTPGTAPSQQWCFE